MEHHVPRLCALALIAGLSAPTPAFAEQPAPLDGARAFDLTAVSGTPGLRSGRAAAHSQAIGAGLDAKPEKVKLRLIYQPDEEWPRFEIGTLGSRKGAMKSRLVHVAMDWAF